MIDWIDRERSVPKNRKEVLVWGMLYHLFDIHNPARTVFLGITKFNCKYDQFDIERRGGWWGIMSACKITHWAEIEGPRAKATRPKYLSLVDESSEEA